MKRTNKIGIMLTVIFLGLGLWSVTFGAQEVRADFKEDVIASVKKATKEEIKKIYIDDYDGNGAKEAFVITKICDADVENEFMGSLYFVTENGAKRLEEVEYGDRYKAKIVKLGGRKLLCSSQFCATTIFNKLWKVEGNQATLYFEGEMITVKGNNITAVHSAYDCCYSYGEPDGGHSWKKYYYFYDKKSDSIKEYGAKIITKEKFLRYKNASKILKKFNKKYKKYKIETIYFRKNNTIQINWYQGDAASQSRCYTNLKYDKKKKALKVIELCDGGVYEAAHNPSIAVYPK